MENKDEILCMLDKLQSKVNTCCAITMEPEDCLSLIEQIRVLIQKQS